MVVFLSDVRAAELAVLTAQHTAEQARLSGLKERVEALRIGALRSGTVLSPRPEELARRWVSSGEVIMLLGSADTVEVRISLSGAGGALVRPGSRVHLLPDAPIEAPVTGGLTAVSVTAGQANGAEARMLLPAAGGWPAGGRAAPPRPALSWQRGAPEAAAALPLSRTAVIWRKPDTQPQCPALNRSEAGDP